MPIPSVYDYFKSPKLLQILNEGLKSITKTVDFSDEPAYIKVPDKRTMRRSTR